MTKSQLIRNIVIMIFIVTAAFAIMLKYAPKSDVLISGAADFEYNDITYPESADTNGDSQLSAQEIINYYYRNNGWDAVAAYADAREDGIDIDDLIEGGTNKILATPIVEQETQPEPLPEEPEELPPEEPEEPESHYDPRARYASQIEYTDPFEGKSLVRLQNNLGTEFDEHYYEDKTYYIYTDEEGYKHIYTLDENGNLHAVPLDVADEVEDDIKAKELEQAKQERTERRKAAFERANAIWNPDEGVLWGQEKLEKLLGYLIEDFTFSLKINDLMKDLLPWWDKYLSGYLISDAICYERFSFKGPIGTRATQTGGFPGLHQDIPIVTIQGERIDYTQLAGGSCLINGNHPAWFYEIDDEGNKDYHGYIYLVSWYISYPYTESDLEDMDYEDMGLEPDGSILLNIVLNAKERSHTGCTDFKDSYRIVRADGVIKPGDPSGLINLSMSKGALNQVTSFYHKDLITEVCINFTDWKYDGGSRKFCNPITHSTLSVPANFDYLTKKSSQPECVNDGDCPSGQYCANGVCIIQGMSPGPGGPVCDGIVC